MFELPDIKFDVADKCARTYCQTCLSSDRALSLIEDYVEVLHRIVDNSDTIATSHNTYLCWECLAVLKRIKLFKERAENAHRLLTYHLLHSENSPLNSLSTLSEVYKNETIYLSYVEPAEVPIKVECPNSETENCEGKEEKDISDNELTNYEDSAHTEEITVQLNEDIIIPKNKGKRPKVADGKRIRKEKYRYVYDKNVRKKSLLKKKIDIKPNEVAMWVEKEINSVYYKKLIYKCKSCLYASNSREKYQRHTVNKHEKSVGPYMCEICKCRFSTEHDVCAHSASHYTAYECGACGLQCYSVRQLDAHLDTHKMVQCINCKDLFSSVRQFQEHYRSLHTLYICDYCGKRCRAKRILEAHMIHHAQVHTCPTCNRKFKTLEGLRNHRTRKHARYVGELAYCVLCDKQYADASVYRQHLRACAAHAHERPGPLKPFPCPLCDNRYTRKSYMMNHYRLIHTNTSKHYCAECDKQFLHVTKYKDHMKYVHSGEQRPKDKICTTCGRGFVSNCILKKHILTHTGERPFECEVCGAKFTQKHSMVSHVKHIHLKSKRQTH